MKYFTIILSLLIASCVSTSANEVIENNEDSTSAYESLRAANVGADNYGMKTYVMAFLNRGSNPSIDSIEAIRNNLRTWLILAV